MLIIGLIIAGIIVDLGGVKGQDRLGFRYWKSPGPFVAHLVPGPTGNFLGFWSTLISAAYSYANVQVVALAGAETRDPRRIIPRALRLTFWRVLVFYVLSMFVVGLIVPSDDPNLGVSTGTAEQSPFVIAFTSAGIKVLPSIINAVVCTSAFSCGSSCVFLASRTILGMAEEGHAPKVFLRTNRFGNPYFAVGISLVFLPLVYLSLGSSSSVVFGWFVNITTVAGLIGWTVICGTYLRFFYGMRWQGISRDRKFCSATLLFCPFATRQTPSVANIQDRSTVQKPTTALCSLDNARRPVPSAVLLGIQRLFPRTVERVDLSDLLHRHSHFRRLVAY